MYIPTKEKQTPESVIMMITHSKREFEHITEIIRFWLNTA